MTPRSKVEATAGYGAEIVTYDRYNQDRTTLGQALAADRGLALIPPYDHPHVIAGQGQRARRSNSCEEPANSCVHRARRRGGS